MRHQGLAEDLLGKARHLGPILRELDAARRDARKKRTPEPAILKLRHDAMKTKGPEEQVEQDELRERLLAVLR